MTGDPKSARGIYQQLLDDIGAAVLANDFEAYRSHILFPHTLETATLKTVINTAEELRFFFGGMCTHLESRTIRDFNRFCTAADYIDETTINGKHDTRLLSEKMQIVERYTSLSTLKLVEGQWRVADSKYASPERFMPHDLLKLHIKRQD